MSDRPIDRPTDRPIERTMAPAYGPGVTETAILSIRRASWGAIFAGVVTAMAIQAFFTVLGLAIGLSVTEPGGGTSARAVGISAAVWFVVTGTISIFLGGWVAGRLAGFPRRMEGALHGFATWGLALLLTVYLLTSTVGALVGGVFRGATQLMGAGAQAASSPAVAPQVQQQAQEAQQQVQSRDMGQMATNVKERAGAMAGQAENAATAGSWGMVAMMILGILAGIFGGMLGSPKTLATEQLDTRVHHPT